MLLAQRDKPRPRWRPSCHETPMPRTRPTISRPRKRSRIGRQGTRVNCCSLAMMANRPLVSVIGAPVDASDGGAVASRDVGEAADALGLELFARAVELPDAAGWRGGRAGSAWRRPGPDTPGYARSGSPCAAPGPSRPVARTPWAPSRPRCRPTSWRSSQVAASAVICRSRSTAE